MTRITVCVRESESIHRLWPWMSLKVIHEFLDFSNASRLHLCTNLIVRFQLARPRRAVPQRQLGFLLGWRVGIWQHVDYRCSKSYADATSSTVTPLLLGNCLHSLLDDGDATNRKVHCPLRNGMPLPGRSLRCTTLSWLAWRCCPIQTPIDAQAAAAVSQMSCNIVHVCGLCG